MEAPVCPDCFTGTLRGDETPAGHEEVINGLPTYVTRPDAGVEPLGSVVFLTDAFGWKLRNSRVLADAYAKRVPCIVYVPDFMNGHAVPESALSAIEPPPTTSGNWFTTRVHKVLTDLRLLPTILLFLFHTRQSVTNPRVLAFLTALRTANTTTTPSPTPGFIPAPNKIGVAGFCWGGLHAILLTHNVARNRTAAETAAEGGQQQQQPLIDCAFAAHPSLLSFPTHIEQVVQPLSVANGDDDKYMGKEKMGVLTRVLEGKNEADAGAGAEAGRGDGEGAPGPRYEVVVYPGAKHGFAVRGDRADPMQRERGEQSEEQAVKWFRRWFG